MHAKFLASEMLTIIISYFMIIAVIYCWKDEMDLQIYWWVERVEKYCGTKRLQIFKGWYQSSAFPLKSLVIVICFKQKTEQNKIKTEQCILLNVWFSLGAKNRLT